MVQAKVMSACREIEVKLGPGLSLKAAEFVCRPHPTYRNNRTVETRQT